MFPKFNIINYYSFHRLIEVQYMLASEQLKQAILKLTKDNYQVDMLLNLASMFERLTYKDGMDDLVAQFHNYAGQYPFINDRDFGALVLEVTATNLEDLSLKKRLIKEAIYRASWCAQAAFTGCEASFRAQHLYRLKDYLKQLQE